MKTNLSKTQAKEKINLFFRQRNFEAKDVKKIKRLAMKFRIRLGDYRKLFCKKCLSKLKGKTRVTKFYKTIECENCDYKNRSMTRKD